MTHSHPNHYRAEAHTPRRVRPRITNTSLQTELPPTSPVTPTASALQSPKFPLASHSDHTLSLLQSCPLDEHEDIVLTSMLSSSERRRPTDLSLPSKIAACNNSVYLATRTNVIDWMVDVCVQFSRPLTTLHVAIRHLDWLMAVTHTSLEAIELFAVCAFLITMKTEEIAERIPSIADLARDPKRPHIRKFIPDCEVIMLDHLGWDTVVQTPAHFLELYIDILASRTRQPAAAESADLESPQIECNLFCDEGPLDIEDSSKSGNVPIAESCSDDRESDRRRLIFPLAAPNGSRLFPTVLQSMKQNAMWWLDKAIYDIACWSKHPPNVLAASALRLAAREAGSRTLKLEDFCSLGRASKRDINLCCYALERVKLSSGNTPVDGVAKNPRKRSRGVN